MEWDKKIEDVENDFLCKMSNEDEIKKALWSISPNKTPGLDGFNVFFFRRKWDKIKEDVIKAVKWFMEGGNMVR